MSYSYILSESQTFTVTHAKHMAAKVATDLKRMQRFYGEPSNNLIENFEDEVIKLLKAGYLDNVAYGFQRNGNWIEPTLRYTSRDLAGAIADDHDPGRIQPNADTNGTMFCSYLVHSSAWFDLSPGEREAFESRLQIIKRSSANEPGVDGYFNQDRTYSAGGQALDRTCVRSY